VFLRLRKAVQAGGLTVSAIAPFASTGLIKLRGSLVATVPGQEAAALAAYDASSLGQDSVIIVGERLASSPGALSAAVDLAEKTGAKLAWIPRRAGDRGAVEAGCLPGLLPFGRPALDTAAREEIAAAWGASVPAGPGRASDAILTDAAAGKVALVVAGVDPADLADPTLALKALEAAPFVVSLEIRESAVTDRADVVFPVVPTVEKAGMFLDWEGRLRPFDETLESKGGLPDHRVLDSLAAELGAAIGTATVKAIDAEIGALGYWNGDRPAAPSVAAAAAAKLSKGEAVLATWHHLLDDGKLQEAEPHLAGTRKPSTARLSASTASSVGVTDGAHLTVATDRGEISLPLTITDMPDDVVWLPTFSAGSHVTATLGATSGSVVTLSAAAKGGS
jgi:NADH-quinone oxidoreductase subunit G